MSFNIFESLGNLVGGVTRPFMQGFNFNSNMSPGFGQDALASMAALTNDPTFTKLPAAAQQTLLNQYGGQGQGGQFNTMNGWGNTMQGLQGIGNIMLGFKQDKRADEILGIKRDTLNRGIQDMNTEKEDRQYARYSYGDPRGPKEYMDKNRLKSVG